MTQDDDNKLIDLSERLKTARGHDQHNRHKPSQSKAMNLVGELVVTPIFGILIGLGLDNLFDTKPLMMIVFFFLGGAAALWRVYKVMSATEKEEEMNEQQHDPQE